MLYDKSHLGKGIFVCVFVPISSRVLLSLPHGFFTNIALLVNGMLIGQCNDQACEPSLLLALVS